LNIVDIHAHHHPDAYTAALAPLYPRAPARVFGPHPDTDAEEHIQARLALMDAAGVGLQVLSPGATRAPYGLDEQMAVHAARVGNDLNAELVERYPDRFKAWWARTCTSRSSGARWPRTSFSRSTRR
jgi:predicted TIM-barrel fold metal-dependent hydrolase